MARKNKNHHLQKIGDVWYFIKMVNGRRTKRPLSTSLLEARKMRDRLLMEIGLYGGVKKADPSPESTPPMPFGKVARKWVKIKQKSVTNSTLRDYRSAMNYYVLPKFGNVPISEIGFLDIEEFICDLECSAKRINNILVPVRSLFKFAMKAGLIEKNPMDLVENLIREWASPSNSNMMPPRRFCVVGGSQFQRGFSISTRFSRTSP